MTVKYYMDLFELDPSDKRIPVTIGYIQSKYLGDYDEAMKQFRLYLEIDPGNEMRKHGDAHNYMGTALLYSGDLEGALKEYDIYEQLTPDSPGPVTSRANAYRFAGDYDEAYRLYSSLLTMDDPGFTVYEGLGRTCMDSGRLREAIEHFFHYLGSADFTGMKVQGRQYLAEIHLIQGDAEAFGREMSYIDDLDPESIIACWLRGMKSIHLDNDIDSARRELSRMISLMENPFAFPEPSRRSHLRAMILFSENRHMGAFEAMEEAERKSPRDFLFFGREHARMLLEAGRTDDALAKCLELSRFNPNDPGLLMIMCIAERRAGNTTSAKEYYERTLSVLSKADEDYAPLIEFKKECEEDPDI
jgi:tetratricopeptide (TPR) repeat protein